MGFFKKNNRPRERRGQPLRQERFEKQMDSYYDWALKARPVVMDLIIKNKEKFDGFSYSVRHAEYTYNYTLKSRPSGTFNVYEGNHTVNSPEKGISIRKIVCGDVYGVSSIEPLISDLVGKDEIQDRSKERKMLIAEIKKRTGVDLREEIKKRDQRRNLEGRIMGIVGLIGFIAGIFFLNPNFTGNIISNLNLKNSFSIGIGLIVFSFFAGLFYINSKR